MQGLPDLNIRSINTYRLSPASPHHAGCGAILLEKGLIVYVSIQKDINSYRFHCSSADCIDVSIVRGEDSTENTTFPCTSSVPLRYHRFNEALTGSLVTQPSRRCFCGSSASVASKTTTPAFQALKVRITRRNGRSRRFSTHSVLDRRRRLTRCNPSNHQEGSAALSSGFLRRFALTICVISHSTGAHHRPALARPTAATRHVTHHARQHHLHRSWADRWSGTPRHRRLWL